MPKLSLDARDAIDLAEGCSPPRLADRGARHP
jgi:hypothetical protein